MSEALKNPSSFRDPSGFIFSVEGVVYRQINLSYKENYDLLVESGLLGELVESNLLIAHAECDTKFPEQKTAYKCIRPVKIPFISYPYEWCFSQLKEAALLTLEIQRRALKHGMTLKDSSSFNIQFFEGKPIFIDTLSFEKYLDGSPWIAYKQFCEHFLAPLALMSHCDLGLNKLLGIHIDGIPLNIASKILPLRARLNFNLLIHIFLHSFSQKKYENTEIYNKNKTQGKMSKNALLGLIDSLKLSVESLKLKSEKTTWSNYYEDDSYSEEAMIEKEKCISEILESIEGDMVWDLGANTGRFSRLAAERKIQTISLDFDLACVEKNYLQTKEDANKYLLPLVMDLKNPSSDLGWSNSERISLIGRGPIDIVMALALLHHLAITNNLPLMNLSSFFSRITKKHLILEFIPKTDPKVKKLLGSRKDIFSGYTEENFEKEFSKNFNLKTKSRIPSSERTLYLMEKIV